MVEWSNSYSTIGEMPAIRGCVTTLGYNELTRRFEAEYNRALGETSGDVLAKLRAESEAALARGAPHEETWAPLQSVYREVDCSDFNDWYCSRARARRERQARIAAYIRATEADLFDIRD